MTSGVKEAHREQGIWACQDLVELAADADIGAVVVDGHLRALAERQHGLITRLQARRLGLSAGALHHRVQRGDWVEVSEVVLRLAGAPVTNGQRALAAVLDAGDDAILSHTSAAAWWRLAGFNLRELHVSRLRVRSRRPNRLAQVHPLEKIPPGHRRVFQGIPIASPALTIFQLAGMVHPLRTERACDNAWSMRLVDGRSLHVLLTELAARGRNGIVVMRSILAERPPSYVPPASGNERRFIWILEKGGEPPMNRQVDLGGSEWVGRVDFCDCELPLVVEILSERYHRALVDQRQDDARWAALQAAGFTVLVFWDTELWQQPAKVLAAVRRARQELRAKQAPF